MDTSDPEHDHKCTLRTPGSVTPGSALQSASTGVLRLRALVHRQLQKGTSAVQTLARKRLTGELSCAAAQALQEAWQDTDEQLDAMFGVRFASGMWHVRPCPAASTACC